MFKLPTRSGQPQLALAAIKPVLSTPRTHSLYQQVLLKMATFCLLLLVLPGLLTACAGQTTPTLAPTSQAKVAPTNSGTASNATLPNAAQQQQIAQGLADLPMSFETNSGQSAANIKFLTRGHGYTLALSDDATATLSLQRATPEADANLDPTASTLPAQSVQLKLVGANSQPVVTGRDLQVTKTNYFLGNDPTKWLHDLPNYSQVQYRAVWPGIDLVYYGQHQQLEYDFVVAPHADTSLIGMQFAGAKSTQLAADTGDLTLQLADGGAIQQTAPHLYQLTSDGQRRSIRGGYTAKGADSYGFWLGPEYDPTLPLTIDPTFGYSTYLGGAGADVGKGVAVDSAGNAYLLTRTNATIPGTTTNIGPRGSLDAVVTKFNPAGSAVIYSTIFGGSTQEAPSGIAVDSSGNAFVTGRTNSTAFPTVNAYQGTKSTGVDVFVTELNAAGNTLLYSTFIGGAGNEQSGGIALDSSGKVYISANSPSNTFPHSNTIGPGGGNDAYIAKFDTSKTGAASLVYSTEIGGTGDESTVAIAVDSAGNAYISGNTTSTNFPTGSPYQAGNGGGTTGPNDAFVFELNATGNSELYGTYLGGAGDDSTFGIALDSGANPKIYVGGNTNSTIPNTTTTIGAGGGTGDIFLAKLNPLVAGTAGRIYLDVVGGSTQDNLFGIAVDGNGQLYFAGSSGGSFPTTSGAAYKGGSTDALVGELNTPGTALVFAEYLGSSTIDQANGIALDTTTTGFAYVAGQTDGTNFITSSPYQGSLGNAAGTTDAFLSKVTAPLDVVNAFSTYQYATINTQFQTALQLTLTDTFAKFPAGVTVTLNAPASGSSGTFVCNAMFPCSGIVSNGGLTYTDTTNASGQFATPPHFMANGVPSNNVYYNVVATAPGFPTTNFILYNTSTNYPNGLDQLSVNHHSMNFDATTSQQNLTLIAGPVATNWLGSINYGPGASGWLTLSANSGALLASNSTTIVLTANAGGLNAGTYTASVTFQDAANTGNSVTVNTTLNVGLGGAFSYYLPFVANGAGGFSSHVTVQNVGNAPATVAAQYYDAAGSSQGTQGATCGTLAANAACVATNPLASGARGTGVIVSNQPLSVIVQESTPFGSSAYTVGVGGSSQLVAPLAINGANGGFVTQLTLANVGPNATTATVRFYDQSGNLISNATKNIALGAHASQTLDQTAADSGLAVGYYGWAKIEGATGSTLVAQVLETRADIKFVALANSQPLSAVTKLYAPAIFRGAFGGFVTGANIVNPNDNATQVTITYYDSQGQAYRAQPFTLAAHAVAPVYQGANGGNGLPNGGLPNGFYGSATVSIDGGTQGVPANSVVMVVNEAGNTTANGAAQSGTFAAATTGSSNVGLPVVANGGNGGFVSGATILNTGDTAVSGTISYYRADGTQLTAGSQSFTIAAHASLPVYQGGAGLPNGFVGQAVVVQTSGAANSLLTTTNVQSPDLFYSYTG